jgi:hypothetical protein
VSLAAIFAANDTQSWQGQPALRAVNHTGGQVKPISMT